jgi:hypothetical protein
MRILKAALLAAISFSICACQTNDDTFCGRHPLVCGGFIAVAGLVIVVVARGDLGAGALASSDARLKRDIRPVGMLSNGINLYAFRYWNDDRVFVGVLAQDLLQDARFRHAVREGEDGYYRVDLSALGLAIEGDAAQFLEASDNALAAMP